MRNDRTGRVERRLATPTAPSDGKPRRRRGKPRLWPVLAVLRRLERLVEAEEREEREDVAFAAAFGVTLQSRLGLTNTIKKPRN